MMERKKIAFLAGWYDYGGRRFPIDDITTLLTCLYKSGKKYFLPNHDVDFIFLTNGDYTINDVKNIRFERPIDGFWEMCLMKILSIRQLQDKYDYIFVHDTDQIYIKDVSEDILDPDFVLLNHWFSPPLKDVHGGVTDIVKLNFDSTGLQWTMGNFFGGKYENMMNLLEMTEREHQNHLGHNFDGQHFYARYPEELFVLKYAYENNINIKRLDCVMHPNLTDQEVFLGEYNVDMEETNKIKNATLLHNTKLNIPNLKKMFGISPKIVVCQFYTPEVSYGEYSEKINRRYCEKNNYEYFVEKDREKILSKLEGRSWTWYKPHLIKDVFDTFESCEYVLFLDIDAIFCNENRRIEDFLISDFSILMTEDYGPSLVNAGVMLIKKDEFSKDFMTKWWDICESFPQYKTGIWHDQTCIGLLHPTLENKHKFKIIPNHDFNARSYHDERFIFHAFSFGSIPNRTIDSIYYKKFNITPKTTDLTELANFYGADKGYAHNYFDRFFKSILEPLQNDCNILEISNSNYPVSLLVWNDFFDNGKVHGIIPSKEKDFDGRIETFIINQSDENEMFSFSEKENKYDIIFDDGTHKMKDQQVNLQLLFKNLKSGGYYVISDLQTSIECKTPGKEIFGWGDPNKSTTLELIQSFEKNNPHCDYMTGDWDYLVENVKTVFISSDRNDSIYTVIEKK